MKVYSRDFDEDVTSATIEKRGGEWCAVFKMAASTFTTLDEFGRSFRPKTEEDYWKMKPVWTEEIALTAAGVKTRVETASYLNEESKISKRALRELNKICAAERRELRALKKVNAEAGPALK